MLKLKDVNPGIYRIKRFSEEVSDNKKSPLETAGKIGLGIGAGAGLVSGGAYLGQSLNVKKLREGGSLSQSEMMKAVNDGSKMVSFKDINKNRRKEIKDVKRVALGDGVTYNPHYANEERQGTKEANRAANALKSAKIKRAAGKTALVAGGLGALAYGGSKLMKKDK